VTTSPIAAGGLVLDVAGALMLASAFMFKRPRAWRQESTTYVGGNAPLFLSAARQNADAWVGGLLLAAGFGAQFIASVGADPSWAGLWLTLPVAVALDAIAFAALWWWLRPLNIRRAIAHDLEQRWDDYERDYQEDEAVKQWWAAVEAWGFLLYNERRPDEGLPEFGRRLVGARRWRRIGAPPPPA
jgi:hypothetical protein